MKQYSLYILKFLLVAFVLSSCTDEEFQQNNKNIVEGIPTKVTFGIQTGDLVKVTTRSAINEDAEKAVSDLFVLVFSKRENAEDVPASWTVEKSQWVEDLTSTSFQMEITTGEKRIYAVANSLGSIFRISSSTSSENIKNILEGISTLEEFQELSASMGQDDIYRTGSLLMCGSIGDGETITVSGTSSSIGTIKLETVDSRIKFDIKCTNGKFIPGQWRVVNVPRKTYVLERTFVNNVTGHDAVRDKDPNDSGYKSDYFASAFKNFEELYQSEQGGGTFTFYMAENRKSAKNTESLKDYNDRERQEKNVSDESYDGPEGVDRYGTNGDFIHVDPTASYVILTGTYTGNDKDGKPISAEVRYTVHLGYVGGDVKDFKNERNHAYTYKLDIQGVDSIKAEVESGVENQPGAEGDVVQAEGVFSVDAHYEIFSITLDPKKVNTHASFMVKTPFDKDGGYQFGQELTAKDYKWVHFLENPEPTEGYQKYPKDGEGLKTIKEVIDYMQSAKDKVTYTVFVDEYYYDKDPRDPENTFFGWKDFVNKPNREMYILCNTEYSPDKASSYTSSTYVISQRSIKTFYDVDKVSHAWGVESVREGNRVHWESGSPNSGKSSENGLEKQREYVGFSWNSYVNSSNNSVFSSKNNALIACLQRNRDLDGDEYIDDDEIKWYMPALNQMTGLWIGKDGLASEAQLVGNGIQSLITQNVYAYLFHFITSDGKVFWAEEGSSTSFNNGYGVSNASAKLSDISSITSGFYYDYRCVRNLSNKSKNQTPEKYADYDETKKIFTLSKLNGNALKGSISNGTQSVENELHSNNLPYEKFQVATGVLKNGNKNYDIKYILNGNDPCRNYNETNNEIAGAGAWRLPNQREMSLICAYANDLETNWILTNTKSSLPTRRSASDGGSQGDKTSIYSLQQQLSGGIITLVANEGVVRCVRDIPISYK